MALVASGLMNKQIAAEIGLAEITVKIHRGQHHEKNGCAVVGRFREDGGNARCASHQIVARANLSMIFRRFFPNAIVSFVGAATMGSPLLMQRTGRFAQVPVISIIDDDVSVRAATNSLVRSLGYPASCVCVGRRILAFLAVDDTLVRDRGCSDAGHERCRAAGRLARPRRACR